MDMSFIHYLLVICFFLAGQSFGERNKREGNTYRYAYPTARKITAGENTQTLKKKMLDVFFAQLLRQEMLANAEWHDTATMLDQDLAEEEAADQLTSIVRYVGVGYNLLKGSPDGSFAKGGEDPGILITQVIFEFTYEKGKEDYYLEKTVQVPDQVNFHATASCSAENRTSVYSGAKSYQDSLNFGINPSGNQCNFT